MPRVPRGFHYPAAGRFPGQLTRAPSIRPIGRLPVQGYRVFSGIPLQPSTAQATVAGASSGGGGGGTPPALVQSATTQSTSGTTLTATLGSATTAGNCLIVKVGTNQAILAAMVSGITLGGSADNFTRSIRATSASSALAVEIWADPGCQGGQTSVVVTVAGGSGGSIGHTCTVEEWSGITTSSPVDKLNHGTAATGTAWSSGSSGTLSQANEMVAGAVAALSNVTITGPGAPWTNLSQVTAGTSSGLLSGYQVVSATTAQTYSGTLSGSDVSVTVIATFKAASSGGGGGGGTSGTASCQLGPAGLANIWYPAQVTLATTTGITTGLDTSVANLYLGPSGVATYLLGTVFGGNGIVAAALPNIQPGLYLIAQWANAKAGDTATMNVSGVMNALG